MGDGVPCYGALEIVGLLLLLLLLLLCHIIYTAVHSRRMRQPLTCEEALYDGHAIGRQCASLVRTDRCCVTHCLTRVQVTHKVVVLHHFLSTKNISPYFSTALFLVDFL